MIVFFVFYIGMILLSLNFNSLLGFWLVMELMLLSFVLLMKASIDTKDSLSWSDNIIYYFFIQSLGSLIFINVILYKEFFSHMGTAGLIMSLIIKLGLPPFYFWVYKMSPFLNFVTFTVLMTLQKFPLLCFMFNTMDYELIVATIFLASLLGSWMVYKSFSLRSMLIASSIYFTSWFAVMSVHSFSFFFTFYGIYSTFFLVVMFMVSNKDSRSPLVNSISYMFFMGLPPLAMFFYKLFSMGTLLSSLSPSMLIALVVSTFMSTIGYFKFFFMMFTNKSKIHNYPFSKLFLTFIIFFMMMIVLTIF